MIMSYWDIQLSAMSFLKKDFQEAAFQAKTHLKKEFTDILENPEIESFDVFGKDKRIVELENKLKYINFLIKGSEGKYIQNPIISSNWPSSLVWNDYLESINSLKSGYGCIPSNENMVNKLIKEKGSKKMESSLINFLRDRIKKSFKSITGEDISIDISANTKRPIVCKQPPKI